MKDISEWRREIDQMDEHIVALLNQRAASVLRMARLKRQRGLEVKEPAREREVLENVRQANDGPLGGAALTRVFEAVMYEMRAIQREESP